MPSPFRLLAALAALALVAMTLARLSHPLLWQDEGETVMFAGRVLDVGYPKVHGPRNVLYEFGPNLAIGLKESLDAYIGKSWGDFYFAAPAVAWARGSDDPYSQSFRVRLPFALAGLAGLAALLFGVLPTLTAARRPAFAAAFLGLCAVSVSLLLHLREARYYGLLVATLFGLLALHLRDTRAGASRAGGGEGGGGGRASLAAQVLLSFGVFQAFHVAWFVATPLLAADGGWRAWRGDAEGRRRRVGRALAPHALALLAVAPWIVFLEVFQVARGFTTHLGWSFAGYVANLAFVAQHFARHELLLPAAAALAAASWVFRPGAGRTPPEAHGLAVRLSVFCVVYAAAGCVNPLVYERYFFVLGPLATCVFLLEAFTLVEAAGRRGRAAAAALALLALAAAVPRLPEVRGYLHELREPVRGPVDFLVEHLRDRYEDPAALVIATNYEAHPLMFHLGSRVIVGLSGNNLREERTLSPDVVVPRRHWPRMLRELARFRARGEWEEVALPVRDVLYNRIPSLTASASTPDPHRFSTPRPEPGEAGLRVYHRVR